MFGDDLQQKLENVLRRGHDPRTQSIGYASVPVYETAYIDPVLEIRKELRSKHGLSNLACLICCKMARPCMCKLSLESVMRVVNFTGPRKTTKNILSYWRKTFATKNCDMLTHRYDVHHFIGTAMVHGALPFDMYSLAFRDKNASQLLQAFLRTRWCAANGQFLSMMTPTLPLKTLQRRYPRTNIFTSSLAGNTFGVAFRLRPNTSSKV